MTVADRGYDDRDTYTSTPDAAAASASYHAIDDRDIPRREELDDLMRTVVDPGWWDEVEELADRIDRRLAAS
ncbi:MAG: hypothetical protein QM695_15970 [Micropruina sp.]